MPFLNDSPTSSTNFLANTNMLTGKKRKPEVTMQDGSETFMFLDIENDMNVSDDESFSDDDSYMSSDDEDDDLQEAEALLRGIQQRRSDLSLYSLGAPSSGQSVNSAYGSVSSLRGLQADEIKQRMMKKSVQHMEENTMVNSASVADIQALVQKHMPRSRPAISRRRSSAGEHGSIGHIGQMKSAQAVEVDDGAMKPDDHLAQLLGGAPQKFAFDSETLKGFFLPRKTEHVEAWTNELTKAVRDHDLPALERMYQKGERLQANNNFGESIGHLTVRRGTPEMLRFLLQDAGVSMRVCCEMGRTPLHDAAWCIASNPKSYQMLALLLTESPMQLLITDKRGYTPLAYVPRAKWAECNAFLDRQFAKGRFASLSMK